MPTLTLAVTAVLWLLPSTFGCQTTPEQQARENYLALQATRAEQGVLFVESDEKDGARTHWRPCAASSGLTANCQVPNDLDEDDHEHSMPLSRYVSLLDLDTGPMSKSGEGAMRDVKVNAATDSWLQNQELLRQLVERLKAGPVPLQSETTVLDALLLTRPFFKIVRLGAWKVLPRPLSRHEALAACDLEGMRLLSMTDVQENFKDDERQKILGEGQEFFCRNLPGWILRELDHPRYHFATWLAEYHSDTEGMLLFISNSKEGLCRVERKASATGMGAVCLR